ncbi:MAG TPA: replication-relaxation family protein [Acidimicrobiales bacterium]|nr:replication-relaxation family protein [Acidimicrobiales bacterium]
MICHLLYDHRVLTTSQVADVGFDSLRKAQQRLSFLFAFEVVDRFQPRRWSGSAPFHFTLGRAGAMVIAAEREVELSALHWHREDTTMLTASPHLGHLVGCNGFFTGLIRAARASGGLALDHWWSARRCGREWGAAVRPDGYAVWVEDGRRLPFLLEYDNGTETLTRLESKLPGYATLARAAGHPTWVLFRFPSAGREAHARRVLVHPEVAVATAVPAAGEAPCGPVWRPVGQDGTYRRLSELGHPSAAVARAPS